MTALHYAAKKRPCLEVFESLVKKGADVNIKNKSDRSAMMIYLHINFRVDEHILKCMLTGWRKDEHS